MITALIVESDKEATNILETLLSDNCPQVSICGKTNTYKDAFNKIGELNPDLVFLEVDNTQHEGLDFFIPYFPSTFEVIVTSKTEKYAIHALNCCASGYLLKPIKKNKLIKSVNYASQRIRSKNGRQLNRSTVSFHNNGNIQEEVIGIPTIEGYEFVSVKNIITCEGMQKCTRIITTEKTDIISSYNLGRFKDLLEQFGFYSPHKSHLVNLNKIRKYHKEGNILMNNGIWVPVAKRRKKDFLNRIKHI